MLRQRVSIVWSRSPPISHDNGFEFPAVEPIAALIPTLRLRLRVRPRLEHAGAAAAGEIGRAHV